MVGRKADLFNLFICLSFPREEFVCVLTAWAREGSWLSSRTQKAFLAMSRDTSVLWLVLLDQSGAEQIAVLFFILT